MAPVLAAEASRCPRFAPRDARLVLVYCLQHFAVVLVRQSRTLLWAAHPTAGRLPVAPLMEAPRLQAGQQRKAELRPMPAVPIPVVP